MPKHDLVVVGAGLAGLTAAALACRMKKNVLVIEPADTFGGALEIYEKSGFHFYPGPSLTYGFESGGMFQRLNEDLGITFQATLRSPCFQVALPDRRITIYAEQAATLDELRREFPHEIDKISAFYQSVRKTGVKNSKNRVSAFLSRSRTAGPFIHSHRFSHEFLTFLNVQSLYFFGVPAVNLSLSSLVTLFDSAPFFIEGGFRTLAHQLVEVLLKNSCSIRYHVPLADVSIKSLTVSLPQETLDSPAVLLNAERKTGTGRVFIGMREEVVPVGMLRDVLFVPDYENPASFLAFSISGKDDETAAPRGMRTLCISFSGNDRGVLYERIGQIVPFLDQFAVLNEESHASSGTVGLSDNVTFKAVGSGKDHSALQRSSLKGIYKIPDGLTPVQAVSSARRFLEDIR